jgi:hypothetical protein
MPFKNGAPRSERAVTDLVASALGRSGAVRYPAFRWVFPIFYSFGTALFVGLLAYQLAS